MGSLEAQEASGMSRPQNRARGGDLDTEGLCLLSLDGGGVRGLSTLMILETLMAKINSKRQVAAKPCEIFDLIGGTSTGGYLIDASAWQPRSNAS
jgi:patatin-like phospholipase/acyl hydrolase